jgi:hypothetical protein
MPAKRTEQLTSKAPAARKPAARRKRTPTITPEDIAVRAYSEPLAGKAPQSRDGFPATVLACSPPELKVQPAMSCRSSQAWRTSRGFFSFQALLETTDRTTVIARYQHWTTCHWSIRSRSIPARFPTEKRRASRAVAASLEAE